MKKKIDINDISIMLDGKQLIAFEYPIKEYIAFDDVIVVCLSYYEIPYNENVFGIDYSGNELWQIPKYTSIEDRKSSFVGLNSENEISCWAVNWDGTALLLEVSTGKILKEKWVR